MTGFPARRPVPIPSTLPRPAVPAPPPPKFVTVAEIAVQLRVSKMTVYRLVNDQELTSVRVRRSVRVPVSAFEAYVQRAEAQR